MSRIQFASWAIGPDAPAHHEQGDRDDQHEQDQEADEIVSPDLLEPDVDIRGVVEKRQYPDRILLEEEGGSVEKDLSFRHADETAGRMTFRQYMEDLGNGFGYPRFEVGGRGQELAAGVVHRDPMEPVAIAEPLGEAIQFSGGIRRDQGGDGFLETFGQDDGPPLQIRRQADPFLPDLV